MVLTAARMLGKKDSFMEVNRVGLFLQGTDTYSLTQPYAVSCPPTGCLHMNLHHPHCKAMETDKHSLTHTHRHTNSLPLNRSSHKKDTESWVARDKG